MGLTLTEAERAGRDEPRQDAQPQPTTDQAIPGAGSTGDPTGVSVGLMGPGSVSGFTWHGRGVWETGLVPLSGRVTFTEPL
jgi:hypothetical protein